ncbi:hypothetical protein WPS_34050 [Vulcanimicrobium alpinum]|uniref:Uncharacterized protein n=1 Tax=Vulcanimicrobium alpinum TaxID=3016050 RepID=A0AAN2CB77_UNVUL|nr:hypothetical protein [Vulcanimicrobium alpinum]BDE08129.1 hypothetical protein WPS_34050 [Vulcanimicrobium alpinum]
MIYSTDPVAASVRFGLRPSSFSPARRDDEPVRRGGALDIDRLYPSLRTEEPSAQSPACGTWSRLAAWLRRADAAPSV